MLFILHGLIPQTIHTIDIKRRIFCPYLIRLSVSLEAVHRKIEFFLMAFCERSLENEKNQTTSLKHILMNT